MRYCKAEEEKDEKTPSGIWLEHILLLLLI